MTDCELVVFIESKLVPVGETLKKNIAYLREARNRFAQPGRRVPIAGRPTFTQWIKENLGISDRHVRRLLAPAPNPLQHLKKKQRRDELLSSAIEMAHAIIGLSEINPDDPSGLNRKAALTGMAFRFLQLARHKPIGVHVAMKELQAGDSGSLYNMILDCLGDQFDQVFAPLTDDQRQDSLASFTRDIQDRYAFKALNAASRGEHSSVLSAEPEQVVEGVDQDPM